MRFAIFRFIGTKDELKRKLAAMTAQQRDLPAALRQPSPLKEKRIETEL